MLIDTHCHLNMMVKKEFDTPLSESNIAAAEIIAKEAADAGVQRMITIGTNLIESKNCVMLAENIETVFASIGLHPDDTKKTWPDELADIKKLITHPKVVAIGECGLDYHRPGYHAEQQKEAFRAQIELAIEYDKALIIHSRDAFDDTVQIVHEYKQSLKRVVFHCFSENLMAAHDITAHGFLLGITGAVTYPKNNELRSIVSTLGLSPIVLETDAPFLPPQIARGQQNHPRHVATIAHYLSQHLAMPYEKVAEITTENAMQLFRIFQ